MHILPPYAALATAHVILYPQLIEEEALHLGRVEKSCPLSLPWQGSLLSGHAGSITTTEKSYTKDGQDCQDDCPE
jgi:hypothetical protein